jgi:dTDP-4-dehydrorhamnose 3,5-epimerase
MKKVKVSKFNVFHDNRGCFIPTPIEDNWVQSNISINDNLFTWRGLHFQVEPRRQSKQISVIQGKIIDVVVGLTEDNLGKVEYYELNQGDSIYVPKGYAHGFLTLQPGTIVNYFVDEIYSPQHEGIIHWSSIPEVKEVVEKYLEDNRLIINQKDNEAIDFEEYANDIRFK